MIPIAVDPAAPRALQRQVYEGLRRAILEGRLASGERIPSTRTLADDLDVSRTTVIEAYRQLRAEGYVEARVGSGTYVADELPDDMTTVEGRGGSADVGEVAVPRLSETARRLGQRTTAAGEGAGGAEPDPTEKAADPSVADRECAPVEPASWDFRVGRLHPDDLPRRTWKHLVSRELERMPMTYGPVAGSPELRRALTSYLARARGVRAEPERIVVVSGSRQAFDLLARLLVDPGDPVVLEEPHYRDARRALVAAGAEPVGVPVDDGGLLVEELPAHGPPPRLICVTPSHQYPTGGVLPLPRRLDLLAWARERGAFVIEDDYDAEFQYAVRPIEALQALDSAGRVVYVGTFSKVLSPDLRLGYVVLPGPLLEPFLALKRIADRHSPVLVQRVLARFLDEGGFTRHLRRMRRRHAARRDALLAAVAEHLGEETRATGSDAGVHLLLRLPDVPRARTTELVREARERGVVVESAEEHYLQPPPHAELLLGYAAHSPDEIREGVARLAGAVRAVGTG